MKYRKCFMLRKMHPEIKNNRKRGRTDKLIKRWNKKNLLKGMKKVMNKELLKSLNQVKVFLKNKLSLYLV